MEIELKLNNFEVFFTEYNKLNQTPVETIFPATEVFFSKFKKLNISVKTKREESLSYDESKYFFEEFTSLWHEEIKRGVECNIWKVAEIKFDEVRVSAILAWILNPQGSHGQGTVFLEKLAPLLNDKTTHKNKITTRMLASGGRAYVETLPLGDHESRVDIEIEGKEFLLFIEVKIYASEQPDQLERYFKIAKAKAGNRSYRVVFLTPSGCAPIKCQDVVNDEIVSISWKDCSANIRQAVESNAMSSGSFIKPIILQFCDFVENF